MMHLYDESCCIIIPMRSDTKTRVGKCQGISQFLQSSHPVFIQLLVRTSTGWSLCLESAGKSFKKIFYTFQFANISSISLLIISCILYGIGYGLCFTVSFCVISTLCSSSWVTVGMSEKIQGPGKSWKRIWCLKCLDFSLRGAWKCLNSKTVGNSRSVKNK